MASLLLRARGWPSSTSSPCSRPRGFRSDAVLEAIARAAAERVPNVALYNYPTFSGAFSALFAHLFHTRLGLPCLILPFSSFVPLRVEDLYVEGLERCYFLDFLGPKGFADALSRRAACEVICFDHRKSSLRGLIPEKDRPENLSIRVNPKKSSSRAAYEYFSSRLVDMGTPSGSVADLLEPKDRARVEMVLKYVEDGDRPKWRLPDSRAFEIGLKEWRSRVNCVSNPYMFEQLLEMNSLELIAKGNDFIASRENAAKKFLDENKIYKIRLGRGIYGECLAVKADDKSDLSDELGKELSMRSAAAGLRPIGAVLYLKRKTLKVCLRTTDDDTDTSEIAKACGGGGWRKSSSFVMKMDEYSMWRSEPQVSSKYAKYS